MRRLVDRVPNHGFRGVTDYCFVWIAMFYIIWSGVKNEYYYIERSMHAVRDASHAIR